LNRIRNFLRVDDRSGTKWHAAAGRFCRAATGGLDVVIHLALPTSDNAMPKEGELVSRRA